MRQKNSDEYYTPDLILNLKSCDNWIDKKIQGPFIDVNCGTGNWLVHLLDKKLSAGISHEEALKNLYGVEIQEDSVEICKSRLTRGDKSLYLIVDKNIICADALRYHYRFDGTDPYLSEQDLHNQQLFDIE